MADKKKRVAILMGGPSSEHEVSLKSGREVLINLDRGKYEPIPVIISREGSWDIAIEELKKEADVAFIAMHGEYGEDGQIQSELVAVGIPYTGSDNQVSALCFNKHLSLGLIRGHGFDIPYTIHISRRHWRENPELFLRQADLMERPWVVKPNKAGSSVGIFMVDNRKELKETISALLEKFREVLIQPRIFGKEVTCGVLDSGINHSGYALIPTEIIPKKSHFFDYNSKYEPEGAEEITPASLPDAWVNHIRKTAKDIHNNLHCRGMSRVDMIIDDNGVVHVLEINTIPGLTKTSLLPKGARAAGIEFPELIDKIIESALIEKRYTGE